MKRLIAAATLAFALSACSAHDIGVSILGGAKSWCRNSGGVCHVTQQGASLSSE